MNGAGTSETKPKEMVSRSIAITFAIICIVLAAGLGGVLFLSYSPTPGSLQTTYNNYKKTHSYTDSAYNSLSRQNTDLQNQNNQLQTSLNGNISQVISLQNQVSNLSNITNLANSTIWLNGQTVTQPPAPPFTWGYSMDSWTYTVNYAGYVVVNVITSATIPIYVHVFWNFHDSHGVLYDDWFTVNSNGNNEGDAAFAVLPGIIEISVGNGNPQIGSTEIVTITYHY